MSEHKDGFGAFLSGFFIGGLVGSITALLLAPQSGEETRDVIKTKGIELRDRAKASADEVRAQMERIAQDAQKLADELSVQAQKTSHELQEKGRVIIEEQKARLDQAKEAGQEASKVLQKKLKKEQLEMEEAEEDEEA
jgi:gas vesicle protein